MAKDKRRGSAQGFKPGGKVEPKVPSKPTKKAAGPRGKGPTK